MVNLKENQKGNQVYYRYIRRIMKSMTSINLNYNTLIYINDIKYLPCNINELISIKDKNNFKRFLKQ